MRRQIFRSICIVVGIASIVLLGLIMNVLYNYFSDVQRQQLKTQTELTSKAVSDEGMDYLDQLEKTDDYRITWIDPHGTVLYDNQEAAAFMGNHSNREEFKEAVASGIGRSDRYSSTLMHQYFYYAKKLNDGTVLRMSTVQKSMFTLIIQMIKPMIFILFIIIGSALFLASRLANRIVEPLNKLNLEHPLSNDAYDEVSPLLNRIDAQQKQLLVQQGKLQQRKEEFNVVMNNMNEGLVLLNRKQQIIVMNHMARELLGGEKTNEGKPIRDIRRYEYIQPLLSSEQFGHKEIIKEIDGQDYLFSASMVTSESGAQGWALFMRNVTEKEQAEKLRREFTANVSHELKTPLHTIRGCTELMLNGLVKPEDEKHFEQQIYKEAQRMIDLVEDIINLSHLDEGAVDVQCESVDLYQIALTAIDSLQEEVNRKKVEVVLHGKSLYIYSVAQLVFSIVYNICDNAIKYNRENGRVDIYIEEKNGYPALRVKDTGIGIPKKDQPRVFDRFYRVDTSRSKEAGGTGLGLSIVKHALNSLNAHLEMESEEGKGTQMTIIFPNDRKNADD